MTGTDLAQQRPITILILTILINNNTLPIPALRSQHNIPPPRHPHRTLPPPPPPPHHASDANLIIPLVLSLSRKSSFTLVSTLPLRGNTFEPEGLIILGPSHLIISSVEYTSPRDPQTGTRTGHAHLQSFSLQDGTLIADASISPPNNFPEHHNSGIDYDGERIYGILSQPRPNSSATVYSADPATLRPRTLHHLPTDHLGTIAVNPRRDTITAMNWGSRRAVHFPLTTTKCISHPSLPPTVLNPSHFIDYQDCKFLGPHQDRNLMLCSGVASLPSPPPPPPPPPQSPDYSQGYVLGGIALVDTQTMEPVFEMPVTLESERGMRMTMNPFDVKVVDGRLRFYWAPDQRNTTLYIYEVQP
ncbi:hypothetical protein ACRE_025050 [Hapsidospora chrysogenum ATCC 11550]|uniref:Uncharacterized protein n=1 Tax=Hapsidospora chrysogenum (strain ATCC 11550 / CBS 779.69 / DSM 880 / IAM 14645 / JCM 23072 / IMI 49137) TaxID=857340 RepID=A0A086TB62_HAPC1|nr:hypothetical protein ACRE_025050 [Hapsidospora chrysogenum ATCC 11550]